ncbi:hypothetical protein SKAU_G00294150 [Synaphobranchus kaupii]|uniref:Essential MCU regulator, mitochondrial n=1 Tax=Synaphobranchus kaupii TaxID=118154 RepID=A0A9Q1ILN4_SYNKA|nr:hypothetical protein SKAU_G00294150 [Synaphobranchus kaupii]
MASGVFRLPRVSALKSSGVLTLNTATRCPAARLKQCRNTIFTASGGIPPQPLKTSFGLFRMTVVVVPFLYVGTLISKNFAALLEEHDIFVPEDDDDDD